MEDPHNEDSAVQDFLQILGYISYIYLIINNNDN